MQLSLKTKVAVGASLLFLVVAGLVAAAGLSAAQIRFKTIVAAQQASLVKRVAARMDADIAQAQRALAADARLVNGALLTDPDRAAAWLRDRRSLQTVFDYRLFLFNGAGHLVAATGEASPAPGTDFSGLPHVAAALEADSPLVSAPYLEARAFHPVVLFTTPVAAAAGRPHGVLAGGVDLLADNLLARPVGLRTGDSGHLAVYTRQGTVVAHTKRDAILASFETPAFADVYALQAGTLETVDPQGVPVLTSTARLSTTGWTVAGSTPLAELYSPFETMRRTAGWFLAGGAAVAVLLTWLLARALTRALTRLTREVQNIDPEAAGVQSVAVTTRDEVGVLATSVNAMLAALAETRKDLQVLAARLAATEEAERRRIAADLHDTVVQSLSLANLHLSQLPAADDTRARIKAASDLVSEAVATMRALIFELSPPVLYQLGIGAALEWYAEKHAAQYGIRVTVQDDGAPKPLADETAALLFRALRELLVNAAKHAGVEAVSVQLERRGDRVVGQVIDSGCGMPVPAKRPGPAGGFGLLGLREQLRSAGGTLTHAPTPGGGTTATVTVKLDNAQSPVGEEEP